MENFCVSRTLVHNCKQISRSRTSEVSNYCCVHVHVKSLKPGIVLDSAETADSNRCSCRHKFQIFEVIPVDRSKQLKQEIYSWQSIS